MMRRSRRKRIVPKLAAGARSQTPSGRIIEKLPDTTLKYKTDSPTITEHPPTPFARTWSSSNLAQSASQETLRPSHPSSNFLLSREDDDGAASDDPSEEPYGPYFDPFWRPPHPDHLDAAEIARARAEGRIVMEDEEEEEEDGSAPGPSGLRRTPSGMFMPYEEDEDDLIAAELGLLGKVNETFNTAKDIAHVIWNVGWRK